MTTFIDEYATISRCHARPVLFLENVLKTDRVVGLTRPQSALDPDFQGL